MKNIYYIIKILFSIVVIICVSLSGCKKGSYDNVVTTDSSDSFLLQIVPTPFDAKVEINGEEKYKIKGEEGQIVVWSVKKDDYISQSDTFVIQNMNITLEVNLKMEEYFVKITSSPFDATVLINNMATDSLMLDKRTIVNWSVGKTGFISQDGSISVLRDTVINVILGMDPGEDPGPMIGSTGLYRYQEEDGSFAAYTTVRAADGKIWLQHNLGSGRVATSLTDADSYGDTYQWGRWRDGHENRLENNIAAGPINPNNPEGLSKTGTNPFYYSATASGYWWFGGTDTDTWIESVVADASATKGVDPCKVMLGNGWRLPTKEEWETVLAAEGITNLSTGFASNLKISAAGARGGNNGALQSVGSYARFWSSTSSTKGNAYLVYINSSTATIPAYSRSGGLSIRCVRDE